MPGTLRITATATVPPQNVLLREPPGPDFDMTTQLRFQPTTNFQAAGLVVYEGPDDFLMINRGFCDFPDSTDQTCFGDGIYFDVVRDGELINGYENPRIGGRPAFPVDGDPETHLRIRARFGTYTLMYSPNGTNWSRQARRKSRSSRPGWACSPIEPIPRSSRSSRTSGWTRWTLTDGDASTDLAKTIPSLDEWTL